MKRKLGPYEQEGNIVMEIHHEGGGVTKFSDAYILSPEEFKRNEERITQIIVDSIIRRHSAEIEAAAI